MIGFLLAAAAVQPSLAVPASELSCRLLTPSGALLAFNVEGSAIGQETISIVPDGTAAWPVARIVATRESRLTPAAFASRAYAAGEGSAAPIIHFATRLAGSRQIPVTLYRKAGRQAALPLAHGFCADEQPPQPAPAVVSRGSPLDPTGWPERDNCRVLLASGRAAVITYFTPGPTTVRLAGGPFGEAEMVGHRRIVHSSGGTTLATFASPGGASGVETLFIHGNWAARLLRIEPDGGPGGESVYGICGLRGLVRRAVRQ